MRSEIANVMKFGDFKFKNIKNELFKYCNPGFKDNGYFI